MAYKNISQEVQKLKEKGLIENIDFRVVYYSSNAEIKFMK